MCKGPEAAAEVCTGRAGVRAAGRCRGEVCTPEARWANGGCRTCEGLGRWPHGRVWSRLTGEETPRTEAGRGDHAGTQWATRRQKRHADPGCSPELCCLMWWPLALGSYLSESKSNNGDIPDRPVVKTLHFYCRGRGFNSRLGS